MAEILRWCEAGMEVKEVRAYTREDPRGGWVDKDGVEWLACDPYPYCWYRREGTDVCRMPSGR